ncbi:MAG: tripartite tricarboxylate transporter TctB family protein [Candidatus Competibacteraceae bacterium]|nr:tripartite tricarboxylate transporter TctB family protein [Candidatus Competibacteraceae bacterium]MCB1813073.1 tripartite tricarboxylate transporter TctB family protein [Candidatus Competibacteraceae bacterium]
MTVRAAELLMAVILALSSLYLMWKSAELPIGWIEGEGPGGGAWPFWLALIMLISCVITIVRWFKGATPESRSTEEYMNTLTLQINAVTVGSLFLMLFAIQFIGMYFSMMLFMLFYLRIVGRHTWTLTLSVGIGMPIFLFFFFEAVLKIIMPKGYAEPLFIPLYKIIF